MPALDPGTQPAFAFCRSKSRQTWADRSKKRQDMPADNVGDPAVAPVPKSKELVVFSIIRDSECQECKKELWKGSFLFLEDSHPLCLSCADLDHLTYLPRGDSALTRRAKKHSSLHAVVVRFSRSRRRYERQGILVSETALEQAEQECLADEEKRARRAERDAARRAQQDRDLVTRMADAIVRLFPGCPPMEARTIAEHTARRGTGHACSRSTDRAASTHARSSLPSGNGPSWSGTRGISPEGSFIQTVVEVSIGCAGSGGK